MLDAFRIATTGIWPIVAHYGFGAVAVAGCLAFAWFSPVFKKTALWIAVLIIAGTVCYAVGVRDGEKHIQQKWDAALEIASQHADQARSDAEHDVARTPAGRLPNDKYDRDQRDDR